jgi:predicted DNA-binding transcriptional regulator AlpA
MNAVPSIIEEDDLLTTQEAAAKLKMAPATLMTWRSRFSEDQQPVPFVKIGSRAVRYRKADVLRVMGILKAA